MGVLLEVKKETLVLCGCLGSPSVFGRVSVAHPFGFLCYALCFVCFRPLSCVFNVTVFSSLSILDSPSNFSNVYS